MKRPVAYVMEQTLGSVTHYLNLRREDDVLEGDRPLWVPIEYRESRVPWTLSGGLSARRAIKDVLGQVDGMFIHTTTLSVLTADLFSRCPTVLSSDGTPLNKRDMRLAYGLKPESPLAKQSKRALYRSVFRRAVAFVAWSNWTKQSFVEDYGCREDDVAVIPPGIHVNDFAPGNRAHALPRILFVGGDFERKGGDLLLDVFRKRLRDRAELILVTRANVEPEPGVHVHRDVKANSEKLRDLYATSDIFALPTRADCYSLVCMEALASGMPLVVTRVGGIPDMVIEGKTGHLVPVDAEGPLGDALERLVTDAAGREEMGRVAREAALRRFDSRDNARRLFEFVRSRC